MRRFILTILLLFVSLSARGVTIDEVLADSQRQRQESMPLAADDDPRVAVIRASFERCRTAGAELLVVTDMTIGETLNGRTVVVHVALGEWPEGERLFILAHEVGHIAHGHWGSVSALWREHLPGEVTEATAAAMPPSFGPLASAMSHDHELAADAYALQTLQRLGFGFDSAMQAFLRFGVHPDTATHPGTRRRVAHLREVSAGERRESSR